MTDNRSMFLKAITDVLSHADNWALECKRRGVVLNLSNDAPVLARKPAPSDSDS